MGGGLGDGVGGDTQVGGDGGEGVGAAAVGQGDVVAGGGELAADGLGEISCADESDLQGVLLESL